MTSIDDLAKKIRGPVPFWFLNGTITRTDIEREMELMHEKGVSEVIVHPRYGLNTTYLSDEWFEIFSWCLEEAKKRDMYLWIYDELNWPSGTAGMTIQHIDQSFMSKYLHVDVQPRTDIDLPNFQPGQFLVAGKYQGGKITKTRQLDTVDQLRALDSNWLIFNCTIRRDQFYVDTLSKPAIDCFKRHTYDEYYKRFGSDFGKTIRAVFTDEPSIYWVSVGYDDWNIPYTEKMLGSFNEKYRYSAVPMIPYLFYSGQAAPMFRADFWEHVSNLFNENYHGNLGGWCRRHGVIYTGHNNHEEPLRYQIRFQGNMFGTMKQENIPGVDHLNKATLGNHWISIIGHKIASSVAHLQGKTRVMSESFGCMGWDTNYLDLKKVVDWQFALGINLLIPHAVFHTTSEMTKRESPPSFFYQSPHWNDFEVFGDYVKKLEEPLSKGKHLCRILILYPLTGLWSTYQPDRKTQEFEHMDNFLNSLCLELLQNQMDFDLVDFDTLKSAKIEDGEIHISNESYDILLLPSTFYMRKEEYDTVDKISKAGVMTHFFLRQMDTDEANMPPSQSKVAFHSTGDLTNFVTRLKQQMDDDVQVSGEGRENIVLYKREIDGERVCFFVNRSEKTSKLTLTLKNCGSTCITNPDTGSKRPMELKDLDNEKKTALLELGPFESVFITLSAQHELQCTPLDAGLDEISRQELSDISVSVPHNIASVFNFAYRRTPSSEPEEMDVRKNPRFLPTNWDPVRYDFEKYAGVYEATILLETQPKDIRLVVDKEYEHYKVLVNDQPVVLKRCLTPHDDIEKIGTLAEGIQSKVLMDVEDLEADLEGLLKEGKNVFTVHALTKLSEPIRLVGDFGVYVSDGKLRINENNIHPLKPEKSMPFFSGTIKYSAEFKLTQRPRKLELDLGDVKDAAAVYINGKPAGKRIWTPYVFDITKRVKKGTNTVLIEVRNNLANTILGETKPFGLRSNPQLRFYGTDREE